MLFDIGGDCEAMITEDNVCNRKRKEWDENDDVALFLTMKEL